MQFLRILTSKYFDLCKTYHVLFVHSQSLTGKFCNDWTHNGRLGTSDNTGWTQIPLDTGGESIRKTGGG